MATFTIELNEVCRIEADSGNGLRLGLSDYPIFDQAYRNGLNRKIIQHYWNREIGLETIPQFTFNLRRKMFEIMPYYNQLYKSTQLQFDPLATFDLRTVRTDAGSETSDTTGTSTNTAATNSSSRTVGSDMPQTMLSEDEDYARDGSDANSNSSSNGVGNQQGHGQTNTTGNQDSHTTGFQGAASDLLMKYRATLLNVDMMIVEDVAELFMSVWDNGDELLPTFGKQYGYYGIGGMF